MGRRRGGGGGSSSFFFFLNGGIGVPERRAEAGPKQL